jgi:serine/threonine protein phosphatase PrpC
MSRDDTATRAWTTGVWSHGERSVDVAAGVADPDAMGGALLVVSEGSGGHATGWLSARFTVRTLLDKLGFGASSARVEGAADLIPTSWGWAGAMQSREAGEAIFAKCVAALGELSSLPNDFTELFFAMDRVLKAIPPQARIHGALASCIAARLEGSRLHGAHVGLGRASLLRAGATSFEDLVIPHYLHLVGHRSVPDENLASLPHNILCNGLGGLEQPGVGVDRFETELNSGDRLLLTSGPIGLEDAALLSLLLEDRPLQEQARSLETKLEEASGKADWQHQPGEVAFVIVRRDG